MKPIEVTKTCYQIDGKAVYLNSGEFHYFRVPRADWKERMALFKEAGGNCLATYSPWLLDEEFQACHALIKDHTLVDLTSPAGVYNFVTTGTGMHHTAGVPDFYRGTEAKMSGYQHEWAAAKKEGARASWRSREAFSDSKTVRRLRASRETKVASSPRDGS